MQFKGLIFYLSKLTVDKLQVLLRKYFPDDEEKTITFKKQWRVLNPPAFSESYEPKESGLPETINKIDIFHYVYAVLHHPAYRDKYELNLKREFHAYLFLIIFVNGVNGESG